MRTKNYYSGHHKIIAKEASSDSAGDGTAETSLEPQGPGKRGCRCHLSTKERVDTTANETLAPARAAFHQGLIVWLDIPHCAA